MVVTMTTYDDQPLGCKGYQPDPALVQYILDELRIKEIRQTRENAGENLSSDEKRFERNLDKRKSTWMNKIFQITADLIFFLECIADKEELKEEFQDEYDDLFGFGVDDNALYESKAVYENTLSRFISSILQTNDLYGTTLHSATTATYIVQLAVLDKMQLIIEYGMVADDPVVAERMVNDFRYSLGWTKFVKWAIHPVKLKTGFRRKIDPHNPVLRDAKSP
jgi:hypothetical protein